MPPACATYVGFHDVVVGFCRETLAHPPMVFIVRRFDAVFRSFQSLKSIGMKAQAKVRNV